MFFRRKDADFQQEIQAHLDLETDRLIAEGMPPSEARAAAHKTFGNVLTAEERMHERSRWMWLEQFVQDIRYGWRGLRKSPAFVATTVLSLSLGISLVVILFAIFNAYVLRPFAVRDPYSLYRIGWNAPEAKGTHFSWRDFLELRGRSDLFDDVTAERIALANSGGRTLVCAFVSGGYFETLGARLVLGRTPAGNEEAVVLSYEAWKLLFQKNPTIVGQTLDVGRRKLEIAGVLGPAFTGLDDSPRDLWVPLALYSPMAQVNLFDPKEPPVLNVVARLRHDVTAAQAQTALTPFMARMVSHPNTSVRAEVTLQATPVTLSLDTLAVLSAPLAAFLLVLLTACANVSNIMLARANARFREISVRLSIGASRGRLVRQLLTEGLLISLMAGILGLALASIGLQAGVDLFVGALPPSAAASIRVVPLEFDHRVFLFTLAAAFGSTLLFALAPALQAAKLPLTDALRGHSNDTRTGSRLRSALVASQVMVSLVLLVATITLARSARALGAADLGIDRTAVVTIRPRVNESPMLASASAALSFDPHIESVAAASIAPLSESSRKIAVSAQRGAGTIGAPYTFVSDAYFQTLHIPILRGRGFTPAESKAEANVAVVSAAAAQSLWPNADPIGQFIHIERPEGQAKDELPGYDAAVVIGIARDVVSTMVFEGPASAHVYFPTNASSSHASVLLARGWSPQQIRPEITQAILQKIHPEPTAFQVMPLEEALALQMFPIRITSWIGSLLGGIALALSLSGLYAVLTYSLSQRRREIGIRMALGASRISIVRLVMAQSMRLAGVGAAIGILLAAGIMKGLSSVVELRNVVFIDMASFAISLTLVLTAALAASLFPACRATGVDPGRTLRVDN